MRSPSQSYPPGTTAVAWRSVLTAIRSSVPALAFKADCQNSRTQWLKPRRQLDSPPKVGLPSSPAMAAPEVRVLRLTLQTCFRSKSLCDVLPVSLSAAYCFPGELDGHTLRPTALVHEAFLKLAGRSVM